MDDTKAIETKLQAMLNDLLARAGAVEDDLRQPLDDDLPEQAIDLADDEALAGIDDVLRREIAEVRAALLRIENGTYGSCAKCGADIMDKRLEVLPTATLCITCARAAD
ncbi:MAG: TraR/DksA family transcriptional regulator [Sphingomonadales bacterium]|nr:TraR/DksA family transcriptional regulator [Sphingomonadales bacterium]MDE2568190.1 TraR/DksA family transcriptional regulator [Sphingomonadales bacterium]